MLLPGRATEIIWGPVPLFPSRPQDVLKKNHILKAETTNQIFKLSVSL